MELFLHAAVISRQIRIRCSGPILRTAFYAERFSIICKQHTRTKTVRLAVCPNV